MIFGIDVAGMVLGGLAAGMVLFIVSVGLSVTMGLMGFVNLAHGGFAMLGGYVIVLTMRNWGIGFIPALALGFVIIAGVSIAFERLLYSRLYRASDRELRVHRGTRIIDLLVSLDSEVRMRVCRECWRTSESGH